MKSRLVIAVVLISASTSVLAWGSREQGALAGFVAGAVVNEYRNNHGHQPPMYQQPLVIYQQAPLSQVEIRNRYHRRHPAPPSVSPYSRYRESSVWDPYCQCYVAGYKRY